MLAAREVGSLYLSVQASGLAANGGGWAYEQYPPLYPWQRGEPVAASLAQSSRLMQKERHIRAKLCPDSVELRARKREVPQGGEAPQCCGPIAATAAQAGGK